LTLEAPQLAAGNIHIIAEDTIDEELLNILQMKKTLQAAVHDIVAGGHYGIVRNSTEKKSSAIFKKRISGSMDL